MEERIPMVNVTARIMDQAGRPVSRARITLRLATIERYCGLIVPREVSQYTDANGAAVLRVWPNELGTEGSEYMATIMYGDASSGAGGCGCASSGGVLAQSQRFRVVVPNADCNLFDICDLPPYEQRGSGLVISAEIASFASQAANSADAARAAATACELAQDGMRGFADSAKASANLAGQAAAQAQASERRASGIIAGVDDRISRFETSVAEQAERSAAKIVAQATLCASQEKDAALLAIEAASGEALAEIANTAQSARADGRDAIMAARESALFDLEGKGAQIVSDMREEIALFGADFEALTERAEGAAKRAGCSAASAANSATKACACAGLAQSASQGLELLRDETLIAARQAETAKACADEIASRVDRTADLMGRNVELAAGSAKVAQEAARSADCSAIAAKQSADLAGGLQQAMAGDREAISGAVERVEKAAGDAQAAGNLCESYLNRTLNAQACADSAAKAAEAAGIRVKEDAAKAAENARVCGELEDACTWAAEKAIRAKEACDQNAAKSGEDRAVVEGLAADVAKAVSDKALELITPQVVAEAIDQAIAGAEEARDQARAAADDCRDQIALCEAEVLKAANEVARAALEADRAAGNADQAKAFAGEAKRQADEATIRADMANQAKEGSEAARDGANEARDQAEGFAARLADAARDPARLAGMLGQIITLGDRLFKLELAQLGAF